MKNKLDNKTVHMILKAVCIVADSLRENTYNFDYLYKLSIAYIYKVLGILLLEKKGFIESKLNKQIRYIKSPNDIGLFDNTLYCQLKSIGLEDRIFASYHTQLSISKSNVLEFLKTLSYLTEYLIDNCEIFGYLYEYLQQYQLVHNEKNPEIAQLKLNFGNQTYYYGLIKTNIGKKKQGSFYTPSELIERLVNSSLSIKLKETNFLSDLLGIKVLDPACGGGNILLRVFDDIFAKAVNEFNQSINPEHLKKTILRNCIFGIDIDEFACEVTKFNLFLKTGCFDHCDNIYCTNFLINDQDNCASNSDLKDFQKFDLIIGNPPYINIEYISAAEKKYYLENYKSAFRRFDIYLFFIEKSLEYLLKENGALSFIIPDKFLTQSYAKELRRLILNKHSIREIISFGDLKCFNQASVVPIIITIYRGQDKNLSIKTTQVISRVDKVNFVDQKVFESLYNFNFRIGWNSSVQEIIEIIQSKSFPLSELCYISWGAQAGNSKKFIFKNPNLVKEDYKGYLKPLIKGSNVKRYNIEYSGENLLYLIDGDFKLHRPGFKELFESEKIVIPEVSAKKGIIAGFDNQKFYTNHSIINCVHKKSLLTVSNDILKTRGVEILNKNNGSGYKWEAEEGAYTRGCQIYRESKFNNICLKYAISLINSKLINFYFNNYLSGDLNVFPELIKFLPVFDIPLPLDYKNDIEEVGCYLEKKEYKSLEDTLLLFIKDERYSDIYEALILISDRLGCLKNNSPEFTALDAILNNFIYKLYGLNNHQIKLVETKA